MRSQQLSRGGAFLLTIPRSFVKSVAAVTCACFLFTSVFSQAIYAMMETRAGTGRAAAAADGFIVPFNTGRVSDAKFFGSDTVVINIQDLHCHPEAQRNIAKILSIIDDKCRLKKVYIEGGVGEIDTSWVQLIEDKRAREQVVEALMDTGKLTGSEYYSIKSGKTDILAGIEDEKIYNENIKRLGQILDKNKAIQSLLPEIEISLDSLRSRYYTARNRRLDKLIEENKKGAISSGKYYAALMKMAGKSNVDITNYPSITAFLGMEKQQRSMNYKKITRELQGAIGVLKQRLPYAAYDQLIGRMRDAATQDELCLSLSGIAETYKLDLSADFPDLAGFITFVEKSQAINVLKLVSEERKLISELHISQAVTNGEKEVTFIVDQFHCLEEYLDNKISAEAYAYFSRNMPEFKLLRAKYINSDKIAGLEPYNELFERFYQVNVQRNQLFLRNIPGMPPAHARQTAIIPAIDHTRKVIGSLKDAKNIVVLITGGFHTSGVSKLLQEQNISYLVITPNITRDTRISGQVYERLAKEQAAINRQTLALEAYSRRLLSLPVDDRYENINDTFVESELTLMFAADPEASPEEIVNKMNEIGRLLGGALAYDRKNSHGGELRFSYSYKDIKTGRSVATAFTYDRAAGKVFLHDDSSSKSGEMQPASESQSAPEKKSLSGTAAGTELIGLALPVLFGLGFAASFLSGSGDAYVSFHDTLLALFHQLPVTLAGAGISFVSLGSISTAKGSREKAGEIEQDILALPHDRNEFVDSVLRAYGSGGNKEERRKYVAYLSGLETDAKTHNAAIDLLGLLLDRDKAVTEQFLSDIFRFQGLQGEGRGLVLGSQSPRRKDILSRMTGGFETATADIEEYRAESGVSYESGMMLISLQKAFAVAKQKKGIILTGDTLVYHDGQANGKQTEGLELDTLKSYSGNKIKAISSVTVIDTNTGEVKLGYDAASMQMKTLDQRIGLPEIEDVASDKKYAFLKSISNRTELTVKEILENYVRENKSKGKAGAFGVQDRDFFLTVESIEGDPFTIVGFPVETVHDLLSVMKVRVRMIDLVPEYWPSPFEQEKLKPLSNAAIAAEKKHGYESIPLLIDMFVTFYDQLFTGKFFNAGNYWAAAKIRESTNILLREAHRELDTIFSSPSNDIETGITRQVAQEIVDRYRKNDAAVDHVLVELYRKIKKDNYAEAMEILAFMLDSDREISEQFLRDLFIAEKLEVMNTENKKVFLASRSGQRKELLKELFESEPEDPYAVDGQAAAINAEVSRHMHMPVKGGSAKSVLMVIALQKAWAAAIAMRGKNHKGILITAHTAMYDDGMLVEDKDNVENPLAWLRSDNGKNITTVSSVALVDNETGMVKLSSDWANLELKSPDQEISALDIKEILDTSRKDEKYEELKEIFDSASKDAIPLKNILDSYIAQGKAKGKAGGFGIQDRDFFLAVESIEGDPFTIVGFPVERTFPILQEFGIKFKNAELEGLIHKYWPSENERRKINSDNVSMVEAKNQQYEKMEVRDNKLIDELEGFGNPENIAGDAGKEALYIKTYLSHIKLQQRMGKLYDAVSAANDLKAKIRGFSGERSKRLSGYLDELLKHIDLAEMGKSEVEWNHYYLVSLDKQREVNKQLDALLNDYNEWSGSFKEQIKQLEIPLKNRTAKDPDDYGYDGSRQYLQKDHYENEKTLLMETGLKNFNRYAAQFRNIGENDEALWNALETSFDYLADADISSDLVNGTGVEKKNKVIVDDRKRLLELMRRKKNDPENTSFTPQPKVAIAVGNTGEELMAGLWQAYLLLHLGFRVMLVGRATPQSVGEATELDILYAIPYFDGIIKKNNILGGKNSLSSSYGTDLTTAGADDFDSFAQLAVKGTENKKEKGEKKEKREELSSFALLTGELWYGNLVGFSELREPPFYGYIEKNKKGVLQQKYLEKTTLFSVHTHKNRSQKLAVRDEKFLRPVGNFVPPGITVGYPVYQIFEPGVWKFDAKPTVYTIKGTASFLGKASGVLKERIREDRKLFEEKKMIEAGRSFLGVSEPNFVVEKNYKDEKDLETKDEIVYIYRTPIRYVRVRITDKILEVTTRIDTSIKAIADKNDWPAVLYKTPDLMRNRIRALNKGFNKSGKGTIETEEERKLRREKVTLERGQRHYDLLAHDVLDVEIPLDSVTGDSAKQTELIDYLDEPLYVHLLSVYPDDMGTAQMLRPAYYDWGVTEFNEDDIIDMAALRDRLKNDSVLKANIKRTLGVIEDSFDNDTLQVLNDLLFVPGLHNWIKRDVTLPPGIELLRNKADEAERALSAKLKMLDVEKLKNADDNKLRQLFSEFLSEADLNEMGISIFKIRDNIPALIERARAATSVERARETMYLEEQGLGKRSLMLLNRALLQAAFPDEIKAFDFNNKRSIRFSVVNPAGLTQISQIIGEKASNSRDTDIHFFTDAGKWAFQIRTDRRIPFPEEKLAFSRPNRFPAKGRGKNGRKIYDMEKLPRSLAGPLDIDSMFQKRAAIARRFGDKVASYSDLVRIGNLFSQEFIYNNTHFIDIEFNTGLPRLDISSAEKYTVIQLAGPHDLAADYYGLFKNREKIKAAFVKAAKLAELNGASAIDINMGSHALGGKQGVGGADFLTKAENRELAAEIVSAINEAVDIPIVVKTRISKKKETKTEIGDNGETREVEMFSTQPDIERTVQFIRSMQEAGASWVALHTRIADEVYDPNTAWPQYEVLKEVVEGVRKDNPGDPIPVFGNGEIASPQDARDMLNASTGFRDYEAKNIDAAALRRELESGRPIDLYLKPLLVNSRDAAAIADTLNGSLNSTEFYREFGTVDPYALKLGKGPAELFKQLSSGEGKKYKDNFRRLNLALLEASYPTGIVKTARNSDGIYGVMVSQAMRGDPFLLGKTAAYLEEGGKVPAPSSVVDKLQVALDELHFLDLRFGIPHSFYANRFERAAGHYSGAMHKQRKSVKGQGDETAFDKELNDALKRIGQYSEQTGYAEILFKVEKAAVESAEAMNEDMGEVIRAMMSSKLTADKYNAPFVTGPLGFLRGRFIWERFFKVLRPEDGRPLAAKMVPALAGENYAISASRYDKAAIERARALADLGLKVFLTMPRPEDLSDDGLFDVSAKYSKARLGDQLADVWAKTEETNNGRLEVFYYKEAEGSAKIDTRRFGGAVWALLEDTPGILKDRGRSGETFEAGVFETDNPLGHPRTVDDEMKNRFSDAVMVLNSVAEEPDLSLPAGMAIDVRYVKETDDGSMLDAGLAGEQFDVTIAGQDEVFDKLAEIETMLRKKKEMKYMKIAPIASVTIDIHRYPGKVKQVPEAIGKLLQAQVDTVVLQGLNNTMSPQELRELSRAVRKLHDAGFRVVTDYVMDAGETSDRILLNATARMRAGIDGIRPDFTQYTGDIDAAADTVLKIQRAAFRSRTRSTVAAEPLVGVVPPEGVEFKDKSIYAKGIKKVVRFQPDRKPESGSIPEGSWLELGLKGIQYSPGAGDFERHLDSLMKDEKVTIVGMDYEMLDAGTAVLGDFEFIRLIGSLIRERLTRVRHDPAYRYREGYLSAMNLKEKDIPLSTEELYGVLKGDPAAILDRLGKVYARVTGEDTGSRRYIQYLLEKYREDPGQGTLYISEAGGYIEGLLENRELNNRENGDEPLLYEQDKEMLGWALVQAHLSGIELPSDLNDLSFKERKAIYDDKVRLMTGNRSGVSVEMNEAVEEVAAIDLAVEKGESYGKLRVKIREAANGLFAAARSNKEVRPIEIVLLLKLITLYGDRDVKTFNRMKRDVLQVLPASVEAILQAA